MGHRLISGAAKNCQIPHGHDEVVTVNITKKSNGILDSKTNMLIEPKIGINFGKAYEEASRSPDFQLNQENIKQRFMIRDQARKDKKPIENESKLENGVWLNVRETASNDGHMITVITDVTESKNSAEMQTRLSSAIDSIPLM